MTTERLTTIQAAKLSVEVTALKRKVTTAKRVFGAQSHEYFDALDKMEINRDRVRLFHSQYKAAAKKAAAPPKPTRKEAAERRRHTKQMRQVYSTAFAEEQEDYLNSIPLQTAPTDPGKPDQVKKRKSKAKTVATEAAAYEKSSIRGVYRTRKFPVYSHQATLNGEGNVANTAQIQSDMANIITRDILPWLTMVVNEHKISKVTSYIGAQMRRKPMSIEPDKSVITKTYSTDIVTIPSETVSTLTPATDLHEWLTQSVDKLFNSIETKVPSLALQQIASITLYCSKTSPVLGGSYIPLPESIENKKCCINVNLGLYSADNKRGCSKAMFKYYKNSCFRFSILAHLHPQEKEAQQAIKYNDFTDGIDMEGISEPVAVSDIPKFLRQNKDLSMHVYGYTEAEGPHILYLTPREEMKSPERHINLLLITEYTKPPSKPLFRAEGAAPVKIPHWEHLHHYVTIRNFNRFMSGHEDTKDGTEGGCHNGHAYCDRCMTRFRDRSRLEEHQSRPCGDTRVEMPTDKNKEVKFTNKKKSLKVPAVIYADFEALTSELEYVVPTTESFTVREQHHKPIAGELRVVVRDDVPNRENYACREVFQGEDCVSAFVRAIHKHSVNIIDNIFYVNRVMTDVDVEHHRTAKVCHECKATFKKGDDNLKKVRDHDHVTGKYRGAACNQCNLAMTMPKEVTVVFHNLRGYDSHLMMKDLATYIHKLNLGVEWTSKVEPIANTIEKYMAYTWKMWRDTGEVDELGKPINRLYSVRFIDSIQHLTASLAALVGNLKPENMRYTKEVFPEHWKLMSAKGIFPYDWYNIEDKNHKRGLPSRESFYSKLTGETVTQEDYDHAQLVYETLDCKNFGDYMLAYLKSDVSLLADVFETYRDLSLANCGLDPIHYMTAPSLSWDAVLKLHGQKMAERKAAGLKVYPVENVTDVDMYNFMAEEGKRGGICMISKRYAKADNKYLRAIANKSPSEKVRAVAVRVAKKHLAKEGDSAKFSYADVDYEIEQKGDSYILYGDANNLYGGAMSQKLPTGDYEWRPSMTARQLMEFDADGEKGLFVRVKLSYPKELHDLHNDYPMAVEKMLVREDMLSPFERTLGAKTGRSKDTVEKLVPNLLDKDNYVLHIKNLQYYVNAGLVIEKVYQVLMFTQYAWMKPYIDFNTSKRAVATSEFEKDFYKLMNNSVFGKTMENVQNRIVVDLVTEEAKAVKLNSDPRFRHRMEFHENLTAVHRLKTKTLLNRPIGVGVAILELSKLTMLRFHYEIMMPKYGPERCHLLFTDTDSLCYHVETGDIYRDMSEMITEFDTSNYPKDHPLYSKARAKKLNFIKDEFAGMPIEEYTGLTVKMNAFKAPGMVEEGTPEDELVPNKLTAKGVKKSVTKSYSLTDYRNVLDAAIALVGGDDSAKPKAHTVADMYAIRSHAHEMYLVRQSKIALSASCNKKAMMRDGIHMLAYGHYRMPEVMAGTI